MTTMRVLGAVVIGAGLVAGCGGGGGGGGSSPPPNTRGIPTDASGQLQWSSDLQEQIAQYGTVIVPGSGTANYEGVMLVGLQGGTIPADSVAIGRLDMTVDYGSPDISGTISDVSWGRDNRTSIGSPTDFTGTLAIDGTIERRSATFSNPYQGVGTMTGNLTEAGTGDVWRWNGDMNFTFTHPNGGANYPNYFEGDVDNGSITGGRATTFVGATIGTRTN